MSSLEKVSPGISPRFFSQKMDAKLPEKNMPSTAANAIRRSAKEPFSIHLSAHWALLATDGTVSMAF